MKLSIKNYGSTGAWRCCRVCCLAQTGPNLPKTWIAPFGAIFMNMIKMTIVPMVFASLVMGMCSLGDIKKTPPHRYENRYLLPCNNGVCHCAGPYFGQRN